MQISDVNSYIYFLWKIEPANKNNPIMLLFFIGIFKSVTIIESAFVDLDDPTRKYVIRAYMHYSSVTKWW